MEEESQESEEVSANMDENISMALGLDDIGLNVECDSENSTK